MADYQQNAGFAAMNRGWRVVLIVSLTLNLMVVGLVGGLFLAKGGRPHHPMPVREVSFGAYTAALSREDRNALRSSFMAEAPNFRDIRAAIREENRQLLDALRAEPFLVERVLAVMEQQRERGWARFKLGQQLLAEQIVAMEPEARRAFSDRLEAALTRKSEPRGESGADPAQR